MGDLPISEQFALMRAFHELYDAANNGQSHEDGHAALNEWLRLGQQTPVQVMEEWKRERKPLFKNTIANVQTELKKVEKHIANHKILIAAGLDKIREANTRSDKDFIKMRMNDAVSEQKFLLAQKKFFQDFVKTMSHIYNENAVKARKYAVKTNKSVEVAVMMVNWCPSSFHEDRDSYVKSQAKIVALLRDCLGHMPLVAAARFQRDDMRRLRGKCERLQKEGGGGGKLGVVMSFNA
tara:strand:- start:253 stop:963 length:711 start_codon:yes stop_codon:yes gene_type:complete